MRPSFDLYPEMMRPVGALDANWDAMIRLSHVDPIARYYVTMAERGDLTREQALVFLAFGNYEVRRREHHAEVERLNTTVPDFIMVGDKRYDRKI